MNESTLAPLDIAKLDLNYLNRKFSKSDPKRILAWCVANIPKNLVQVSTFNIDDIVITDLIYRRLKPILAVPVLFINTLHHFPETLQLVGYSRSFYALDLKLYQVQGANSPEEFAAQHGESLWSVDFNQYHFLTHVEPLNRGLTDLQAQAWLSNRRRHSSDKQEIPVFERDEQGRLKINPLAHWTRTESWAYSFEHDLVYNPLHDQGYTDIGDQPLSRPKIDSPLSFSRLW